MAIMTKDDLIKAALQAAAEVVNPDRSYRTKDDQFIVVPIEVAFDLTQKLQAINEHVKSIAKLESAIIDRKKMIQIPANVARTLRQYHEWGVDLWSYAEVELKCRDYQDHDVLSWLVQYREHYRVIVSQLI